MADFNALDIYLHDRPIATLTNLQGDRNLLLFNQEYIDDLDRSLLSLCFLDSAGNLLTDVKSVRSRLPPFFSNLLPEGHMREYLAQQAGVSSDREFFLLAALGRDLPGALKVIPTESALRSMHQIEHSDEIISHEKEDSILRFSLAGVQLKFSAIWEKEGGLTIPVDGVGGSWIVKLPSAVYPGVPENEFVMMELARKMGIDVPETALVPINQIAGLPEAMRGLTNHAFIIKRFDRTANGLGVHMEDFAQVFSVFPEGKYKSASYRNIVEVISKEVGEKGVIEFIRRFVFNALIGNGDMHLKNWSLLYPDKRHATLAPAYDFVSTLPYIQEDSLALNFVDSKSFQSLNLEQFKRFSAKAQLPEVIVLETAIETVKMFKKLWRSIHDFPLDKNIIEVINKHLARIPLISL